MVPHIGKKINEIKSGEGSARPPVMERGDVSEPVDLRRGEREGGTLGVRRERNARSLLRRITK